MLRTEDAEKKDVAADVKTVVAAATAADVEILP